jgi:S-DNA-T family DNA segregation ATPase FtsK/SpoIIIE
LFYSASFWARQHAVDWITNFDQLIGEFYVHIIWAAGRACATWVIIGANNNARTIRVSIRQDRSSPVPTQNTGASDRRYRDTTLDSLSGVAYDRNKNLQNQRVKLLPLYHQLGEEDGNIPPVTAVLGLAEDGAPLLIRLPSPDVAHILVAGTTGSGKTVLMQTMILSLAMANPAPSPFQTGELVGGLRLMLIDPKGYAFGVFQGLPHLARDVIREAGEAAEALQSLVHLMERQGSQRETVPRTGTVRIVVVIDELADLLMVGGKDIEWALTRLTQRGREAGIHIIAATQKPSAQVLGPLIKANFPVRLVGRVTCASDARTATGWSGTGAERLMGRGDFVAIAEGRVMRFQAAHVSPEEIREAVAYLAQNEAVTPSVSVSWTRPLARLAEAFRGGM